MNFFKSYTFFFYLQAYSVYDEEIGYCQGQSFLAAVLLLHVSIHELLKFRVQAVFANSIIISQHTLCILPRYKEQ